MVNTEKMSTSEIWNVLDQDLCFALHHAKHKCFPRGIELFLEEALALTQSINQRERIMLETEEGHEL